VVQRLACAGYTDCVDGAASVKPEKVISETALLVLWAGAHREEPGVGERVASLVQALAPHARGARMRLGLCLEPALCLDYAQAHACLHRIGLGDESFDRVLDAALASQAAAARERVPHRELEQCWIAELLGKGVPTGITRRAVVGRTVLARPLDVYGSGREDLYAFTHALMYALEPALPSTRLPRARRALLAEAEAALARCIDEQDYDLAGELLLAWPLMRCHWSAGAAFAANVLARVEDEAGFLPCAATRLDRLAQLEGDARTDYLLATAYHTVYVMGLLCAASLRPGSAPARSATAGAASASARLLAALPRGAGSPHWRDQVEALDDGQKESLAGFLLAMALRRFVVARDFASLHGLLLDAHRLGLADTPAASQAAELLHRLAASAPSGN
jgi:hypothetical protein